MPSTLRELFVTIVLFCMPANPKELFNKHYLEWSDDFKSKALKKNIVLTETQIRTLVLLDIKSRLQSWDRDINIINIPQPTEQELKDVAFSNNSKFPVLIQEELEFDINNLRDTVAEKQANFTESQMKVFDTVMKAVEDHCPICVFVDARGGTGKTFVLNGI
jgi:ATP-dependent DNA helicase PIF1